MVFIFGTLLIIGVSGLVVGVYTLIEEVINIKKSR